MQDNPNAFKLLISAELVKKLGKEIQLQYPEFNTNQFKKLAPRLDALELKQRVRLIRDELAVLLLIFQKHVRSC